MATLALCRTGSQEAPDIGLIALLDRAPSAADLPATTRARLLARRAVATYWLPHAHEQSQQISGDAVALAKTSGDLRTLGEALVARQFTLRGPHFLAERLAAGTDVLGIAR